MNPSSSFAVPFRFGLRAGKQRCAFTIVELLAAMAVMAIILGVIFSLTQQAGNAWRSSNSKIEAFQGARAAFNIITETLGQATLNSFYDYANAADEKRTEANADGFIPARYKRYSDLQFVLGNSLIPSQISQAVFFQTPKGYATKDEFQNLDGLLNACGYFIRFDKDLNRPELLSSVPSHPPERYRYRLYQFLQPSQELAVFATQNGNSWFVNPLQNGAVQPFQIAENVIALVFLLKDPNNQANGGLLSEDYNFDSRSRGDYENKLPPMVEVVMVAIDEVSARRLENGTSPPDFGVSDLFRQGTASLDNDLKRLEDTLSQRRVNYHVFRTTVALRNSK